MQVPSKLIIYPKSILKTQSFSISKRLRFFSNISQQPNNNINADEETDDHDVKSISSILKNNQHPDWFSLIKLYRNKLNPCLVQSVLEQNRSSDPNRVYGFFKWSSTQLARNGTSQNLTSFYILFKLFCDSRKFVSAKNMIQDILKTQKPPVSDVIDAIRSVGLSSLEFSQLIYIYKDNLLLDEAVLIVLNNADYCFPNLVCLNVLMTVLRRSDKMDLFWKVYERLVQANVTLNNYIYNNVISAYCRCGQIEDAKRIFLEMWEKNCSPDGVTYCLLIQGLCKHGRVNEALSYEAIMKGDRYPIPDPDWIRYYSMNGHSFIPDSYNHWIDAYMKVKKLFAEIVKKGYNNLINAYLRDGEVKAEKLFSESMKKMYHNWIDTYVRDGKVRDAKNMINKMVMRGYNPTLVTYNVLISGLCKTGFVDTALEIKDSMMYTRLKAGRSIDGLCKIMRTPYENLIFEVAFVSPDRFTYNALITKFLKRGKTYEAFKLKDEMIAKGVEVDLVTYNCIIDGLCKLGQCESAIKTLNHMREEGVSPDVICYNSLILGLCKLKRMEEARVFLSQMMEDGVKPNAFTFEALISAFISIEEIKVANAYITEMIGHGIIPDQKILASMIDGHCEEGNPKESLSVLRKMVAQGIFPDYNTFIQGFARNQLLQLAIEVFKEFQEEVLDLDVLSYNYLISEFIQQDDILNAFRLFNDMKKRKVLPDIVTYNTLISGLCKMGNIKRAKRLFDEIPRKGLMVNALTCITIVDGYCKTGNLSEAFRLLDEMSVKKIKVNASIYRSLVNGCCRKGDSKWGLLLFDKMVKSGFESTPAFNTLIDGFSNIIHNHCKSGKIKEAEHLLMEMKRKELTPTIAACTSLLHSYIKSGDKSKIFSFLGDLTKLGILKNEVLDLLLDGFSEEYTFEKSLELLDELVAKELCCRSIFDRSLYFFCKKGKFFEALACIDEVKKRGVTLSSDTCEALIAGLKNHGYDDETVGKLFGKYGQVSMGSLFNQR